jgi:hypothetical protein
MLQSIPGRCQAACPLLFPFALALMLGSAAAHGAPAAAAFDDAAGRAAGWSLSGFGTLGLSHASQRQADYTTSVLKKSGVGATHPWSVDVDSRFGAQLDLPLNRRWSAVVQVVSEQRLDNTYRPRVEWANVKYQVTPELALRVGRIALPMFLTADYRKVGYAYPWVRPPVEGYGSLPISSSDGVDATLHWDLGRVHNATQLIYGHEDVDVAAPLYAVGRGLAALSNTSDWGDLSLRLSMIRAEVTTNAGSELFDALKAFGAPGLALTRRYAIDHKQADMLNVGLSYDPGRWFVMAEAGRTRTHSLLGTTHHAYLSGGWRWHALTPYATWSRVRAPGSTAGTGLALDGLPPALAAQVAAVNGGLDNLLATASQQSSTAAGIRWDLRTDLALKLQYDRVKPLAGSRGTLINPTPAFRSERAFHVASVALDFVY